MPAKGCPPLLLGGVSAGGEPPESAVEALLARRPRKGKADKLVLRPLDGGFDGVFWDDRSGVPVVEFGPVAAVVVVVVVRPGGEAALVATRVADMMALEEEVDGRRAGSFLSSEPNERGLVSDPGPSQSRFGRGQSHRGRRGTLSSGPCPLAVLTVSVTVMLALTAVLVVVVVPTLEVQKPEPARNWDPRRMAGRQSDGPARGTHGPRREYPGWLSKPKIPGAQPAEFRSSPSDEISPDLDGDYYLDGLATPSARYCDEHVWRGERTQSAG